MTDARVIHFEIVGNDYKALQDWYSNRLGWQFKPDNDQFAAEHPGAFSWEYLERGTVAWRVRIGPVAASAAAVGQS